MPLSELTDRDAVLQAIREFDSMGREAFLAKYRFGRAQRYFVESDGRRYNSKAIVGAAFIHQHGRPLKSGDFSGGDATVVPLLGRLGFRVTTGASSPETLREMIEEVLLLQTDWNQEDRRDGSARQPRPR